MGIFYSPMRLIGLIKDSGSIAKELEKYNPDWYFSKSGEKAYHNAKTPAQKTAYFFNYLASIADSSNNREVIYKIAYVMMNSMDKSSMEFAGYPNILDASKNPLVKCVKTKSFSSNQSANGMILLAELMGEDSKELVDPAKSPYSRLTYQDTDMYRIERDIIGAFCTEFSNTYVMPPYFYDIVKSSKLNADDEAEG